MLFFVNHDTAWILWTRWSKRIDSNIVYQRCVSEFCLNLMEILLQFFHTSVTDIFKNIFPFTVFFFAKTCFLRTSIFLDVFPSSPLSFIFGSLPLRLSVDLFSTSFFHFVTTYLLIAFLYSRLLPNILFCVHLLILRPSGLFHSLHNFVPRFLFVVLFLFFWLQC